MNRDEGSVRRVIAYCDRIEDNIRDFGSDEEDFLNSHAFQGSCAFCVFQIGETVKRLSAEFLMNNPNGDWSKAARFRDIIAHQYDIIDLHILWETLVVDMPKLKALCEQSLRKLGLR
ncbi:MAG: DUF86 domain-containing protein [Candidatus Methanoplasma sp.]|jgi:uncharacterized protein with HEPN domain|nr:DUF86 domain-containing protein [Candidatus Methanoplasma sp.]